VRRPQGHVVITIIHAPALLASLAALGSQKRPQVIRIETLKLVRLRQRHIKSNCRPFQPAMVLHFRTNSTRNDHLLIRLHI
jgi:hypothetical protein